MGIPPTQCRISYGSQPRHHLSGTASISSVVREVIGYIFRCTLDFQQKCLWYSERVSIPWCHVPYYLSVLVIHLFAAKGSKRSGATEILDIVNRIAPKVSKVLCHWCIRHYIWIWMINDLTSSFSDSASLLKVGYLMQKQICSHFIHLANISSQTVLLHSPDSIM